VALTEFIGDIQFLGRNAAKLARKLGEFAGDTTMFLSMAASNLEGHDSEILLSNLADAIFESGEYNDPAFVDMLMSVFSDPAMIIYTRTGVDIKNPAMLIAGNWGDLWQGIHAARAELGLGMLDREKAALFWKERIYRPAREGLVRPAFFKKNTGYYKGAKRGEKIAYDYSAYGIMKYRATIEARMAAWGGKAPYWLWLNYGNAGGGEYPTVKPTEFVEKSEVQINILLEAEMLDLINEFTDAVNDEVENFLTHPRSYEPGSELARFEFAEAQFVLGVSPTGELSIRRAG
jgi:hypothetical protein